MMRKRFVAALFVALAAIDAACAQAPSLQQMQGVLSDADLVRKFESEIIGPEVAEHWRNLQHFYARTRIHETEFLQGYFFAPSPALEPFRHTPVHGVQHAYLVGAAEVPALFQAQAPAFGIMWDPTKKSFTSIAEDRRH